MNVNAEPTDFRLAELERRLDNLLRIGTVAEADYASARVRVQSGDMLTGWVPWLTRRAGNDNDWWAPEVGEQVVLMSPCGDPAQAVCLPALYQSAYPAPEGTATVRSVRFADGTRVSYDRDASRLTVQCAGDVEVVAAGHVTVTAADRIDLSAPAVNIAAAAGGTVATMTGAFALVGSLSVEGNIQATGSIIDGGGNTNHHTH